MRSGTEGDEEDLEDAATVLMTGAQADEMLGELKDLYRREITGEVPQPDVDGDEAYESESQAAPFRLLSEDSPPATLPPGTPAMPQTAPAARAGSVRPLLLGILAAFMVAVAVAGALQLL